MEEGDNMVKAEAVYESPGQNSANCFVVKILTSNPLALKILQRHFAKPAPVAAFRGGGGRGYPTPRHTSPKQNQSSQPISASFDEFF